MGMGVGGALGGGGRRSRIPYHDEWLSADEAVASLKRATSLHSKRSFWRVSSLFTKPRPSRVVGVEAVYCQKEKRKHIEYKK